MERLANPNQFKTPDPACEPFITRCLQLLDKRFKESREGKKFRLPDTLKYKKFSERELGEETGFNWPALKDGRRRALPPREVIMVIADYLECSLNERNDLLASAHYGQVEVLLEGEVLEEALKPCRVILYKYIHYPACIVNRNWNILEVNPAMLSFFGLNPAYIQDKPDYVLNLLWLIFDPTLTFRPALENVGLDNWQQAAHREVLGFRLENRLSTQENWYKEMVRRLEQLPGFADIYASADPSDHNDLESLQYITKIKGPDGGCVKTQALFVRTGSLSYPQIIFFVPTDKYSADLFRQMGFNLPDWHDNYIVT